VTAVDLHDCRDASAAALTELARSDDRVVAVCNDSVGSSKLAGFQEEFPDRLVNVGIAEQNMVSVAAGLANGGLVPYVHAATCFLTARALEQIKVDAAYSGYGVNFVGVSSGMAYGELGPTHHSIEDIAWLRAIDRLSIVVPADPAEHRWAIGAAAGHDRPVFIRTSRMGVPDIHAEDQDFEFGRAPRLREGSDLTIIANGTQVSTAVQAAERLADRGVEARVLNMSCIAPFDRQAIIDAAVETGHIVTIEEATVRGALGGIVAETVVTTHPVPMRILGVPEFAPTGSTRFLFDHFGLSVDGVLEAVEDLLEPSRSA
jgi:transketolase